MTTRSIRPPSSSTGSRPDAALGNIRIYPAISRGGRTAPQAAARPDPMGQELDGMARRAEQIELIGEPIELTAEAHPLTACTTSVLSDRPFRGGTFMSLDIRACGSAEEVRQAVAPIGCYFCRRSAPDADQLAVTMNIGPLMLTNSGPPPVSLTC